MAIELTRIEEFALITLNRPDALNALSMVLIGELSARLEAVAKSGARALIITGAGAIFPALVHSTSSRFKILPLAVSGNASMRIKNSGMSYLDRPASFRCASN